MRESEVIEDSRARTTHEEDKTISLVKRRRRRRLFFIAKIFKFSYSINRVCPPHGPRLSLGVAACSVTVQSYVIVRGIGKSSGRFSRRRSSLISNRVDCSKIIRVSAVEEEIDPKAAEECVTKREGRARWSPSTPYTTV